MCVSPLLPAQTANSCEIAEVPLVVMNMHGVFRGLKLYDHMGIDGLLE